MAAYKKFLIQQQTFVGDVFSDVGILVDTQALFRVVCQECPFLHMPNVKDLAKRDWHDENGDDVYFPTDGLKYEAYDMKVKFLYVGSQGYMRSDLRNFIDFIHGRFAFNSEGARISGSPVLAIYDDYTKTGRRNVYVNDVDNDFYSYDNINSHVIGSFSVKFRVNDPVTNMTYNSNTGKLVVDE